MNRKIVIGNMEHFKYPGDEFEKYCDPQRMYYKNVRN